MADTARIREHREVVGSDGRHVGTVDHVAGGRIKLTRSDPAAGGEHHYPSADRVRAPSARANAVPTTPPAPSGGPRLIARLIARHRARQLR